MKKYNDNIMKCLRQRRGLDENDITEDEDIMKVSKQDSFAEYCRWNGLLGNYGYELLNVIEDIYDVNLQQ